MKCEIIIRYLSCNIQDRVHRNYIDFSTHPFCTHVVSLSRYSSPPISLNPFSWSPLSKVRLYVQQQRRVLRDCRTRFKTIAFAGVPAFPQVVEPLRGRVCEPPFSPSFSFLEPRRECVSVSAGVSVLMT